MACRVLLLLLGLLISCRMTRMEQPIPVPEQALEEQVNEAASNPQFELTEDFPENWWELFHDEQLDSFIEKALCYNPTVQIASANIRRAKYNSDAVFANLFPFASLQANVQRQKVSKTIINPLLSVPVQTNVPITPPAGSPPFSFTEYYLAASIIYDLDLWGKNRSLYQASVGELYASSADAIFTRLAISIAVAETYFAWQVANLRFQIAHQQVATSQALAELIRQRVQNSIANAFDLLQAEENVQQYEQLMNLIEIDLIQLKTRLQALLGGEFDEIIEPVIVQQALLEKFPLPRDLPFHLLGRRPDITAQLWLIDSKYHIVQAANAQFYPDLNFMALAGYNTLHFSEFFKNKSAIMLIEPAINMPLFTGGQLLAQFHLSEADLDRSILEYNRLVLEATKEVLDGIQILQATRKQYALSQDQLSIQSHLYELSELKKRGNLSSNFEVLTSRSSYLLRQDDTLQYLGRTLESILQLIKAIGGGFSVCEGA